MRAGFSRALMLSAGLIALPGVALAQQTVQPVVVNGTSATGAPTYCYVGSGMTGTCSLPISGSFSVAGFTPNGNYTDLTATGSSARAALPTGTVVVAYNTGTTAVSCVLGNGSVVATTNEDQIAPGGFFSYTVGSNANLACIDQSGSVSNVVVLSGGAGIASGAGGGGGSSTTNLTGINGVTPLVGAGATGTGSLRTTQAQDTSTVAGAAPTTTGIYVTGPSAAALSTAANQATEIASLATIATNSGSAIPAGTNLIGKVGIDQTTPGTTNNVTLSPNVGTLPLVQATASVPITFTAAGGPTQIIAASGSTKIYITHIHYVLSGAGTFALVTGTGTNCGTNTAYLEGASGHPLSYAANGGISAGGGLGPIYVTGAGGEICAITTGSVDTSGVISYAQF